MGVEKNLLADRSGKLTDNALRYAKSYIKVTLHEDESSVINDGKNISKDRRSVYCLIAMKGIRWPIWFRLIHC